MSSYELTEWVAYLKFEAEQAKEKPAAPAMRGL